MIRGKRGVCNLLCLTLLFGGLCGCGKENDAEEISKQEKGGYVETELSLTRLEEDQTIKQIFSVGECVHLLTAAEQNGAAMLREWEQEGENFSDVSREWLTSLKLDCETWADMELLQGKDGIQYLFVRVVNEEGSYEGQLWREDGNSAKNITPEKWTEPDETRGTYEDILGVAVLNNGNLAAVSNTSIDLLSGEDGSVLESEAVATNYGETVLTDGRNLYITTLGGAGGIGGIEKRPEGRSENAEQLSLPANGMGEATLCVMEDGTLIVGAVEGIFRYNIVTEAWEKLLDGSETDFAMTTCWCMGMTALEDGRIYALFQEDGGIRLVQYEYDPEAVKEVTQELRLYTVWENSLLQQAAVLYHKEHPDVLITVEYAYSVEDRFSGEVPDYNQVYQNLNTMLMGDNAPDIIVMDHLNMDTYVEKGMLLDLGDIVGPMEERGELLANITGAYIQENGSRYAVPLQFGFTMAVGRQIGTEDMGTLEALAEFLAGQEESYLGPLTAGELVDLFYPYFCGEIVKNGALDREVLAEKLEYLKVIADNSGIIEYRSGEDHRYNSLDLPSHARLALEEAQGYYKCMFPVAVMEYIGGDMAAFENCFVPYLLTGINARSPYQDTARDFLTLALSQEVQDVDYYNGFPVNLASLEKQEVADRSNVIAATVIETADGGEEIFTVEDYDLETARRLTELCRGLERPIVEDEKIREELIAALPGFLGGSRSLEQTLDSLEGSLRMYLAE